MRFIPKGLKEFERVSSQIWELEALVKKEIQEEIERLHSAGWQKFIFFSSYTGSHSEFGEKDLEFLILFSNQVIIPEEFMNSSFMHGHHAMRELNKQFKKWVNSLEKDQWLVFEEEGEEFFEEG